MIGIYKITSPSNKVYIGQSVDIKRRWINHKCSKKKSKLNSSLIKYGDVEHTFEVIEECTVELLNERERYWQDFYGVLGPNGLNHVLQNTDELAKINNEEFRETRRRIQTGKFPSRETRDKMSKSRMGRVTSEETRRKISIANKDIVRLWSSKRVQNIKTREIFNSIRAASKSINMKEDLLAARLRGETKNNTNLQYYEE